MTRNITGTTSGRLVVIRHDGHIGVRRAVLVECSCGTRKRVTVDAITSNHSRSCGCLKNEMAAERGRTSIMVAIAAATRHGHAPKNGNWSGAYRAWVAMRNRCSGKGSLKHRRDYFDRGIRVCERWDDFQLFLADMGDRPAGLSLDRYPNNDGNYEPSNCRWATASQQALNRRPKTCR